MPNPIDIQHMRHALELAAHGLGHTWPNPSVGAVVVRDGAVVGVGATARGGRPHAETLALAQAGEKSHGATLYVTLEPCSHHGKTPPCAEAVIVAGIKRVVIAVIDPNPKVSGRGLARLCEAGIEVTQGICEREAQMLNEGFFSVIKRRRPFVALKTATTLDGKITTGDNENKWITGEASRRKVHELRATYDAILTGIGTVLGDDPLLTCRLPGREADSPQRVVMDRDLRIPVGVKVLPAWIFTSHEAIETEKAKTLQRKDCRFFAVNAGPQGLSLLEVLEKLAQQGITRLLVEAGSALAGSFMREGLVDRLYWFRAPFAAGSAGLPAFAAQDILAPSTLAHMHLGAAEHFGEDVLEVYDSMAIAGTLND